MIKILVSVLLFIICSSAIVVSAITYAHFDKELSYFVGWSCFYIFWVMALILALVALRLDKRGKKKSPLILTMLSGISIIIADLIANTVMIAPHVIRSVIDWIIK